jgi:hypothetical protein
MRLTSPPSRLDLRWLRAGRAARWLRWLAVAAVVLGLAPLGDLAEVCGPSHVVEDLSVTAPDDDGCADHRCTPVDHHCRCCVAAVVVPDAAEVVPRPTKTLADARPTAPIADGPTRASAPPKRPPIA